MKKNKILSNFEELVNRASTKVCIISPSRKITVGDINRISEEVSEGIDSKIKGLESMVGISAPNGPGFLALLLAVFRLGKTVLLHDSVGHIFERKKISKKFGVKYNLIFSNPWPNGVDDLEIEINSESVAPKIINGPVVKLTSGTSGEPRGIVFSEEALLADEKSLAKVMEINKEDIFVGAIPFNHSYGFSSIVLPALLRGNSIAIPDENGPFEILNTARLFNSTVFHTTPAYLEAITKISGQVNFPRSIQKVISAGAPLPQKSAKEFRKKFNLPVSAFYGASECGGICFDQNGGAAERGTVGEPIPGVQITIEKLNNSSGFHGGRIIVQSPGIGDEYFPDSDSVLGGGKFFTSDIGIWEGTELKINGRIDEMLIIKGININPKEIEDVILLHPSVENVKVFGGLGKKETEKVIHAVISCKNKNLQKEEIVFWCKERLQGNKIPRNIQFVRNIPSTKRGKIDMKNLANYQVE